MTKNFLKMSEFELGHYFSFKVAQRDFDPSAPQKLPKDRPRGV